MKTLFSISLALLGLLHASASAQLVLPSFFSDHMVLQRDRDAAIWGKASPNAEVKIRFKGKTATTKADTTGKWRATIATGKADANGAPIKITSGDEGIAIQDVLVGEVWLASGQSNMAMTVGRSFEPEKAAAEGDLPGLRFFSAPTVTATEAQWDIKGDWTLSSPKTVPGYSAAAYFFARKLHKDLGIPVGILKTAWGGKPVEAFTSREALNTHPGTKALVDALLVADAEFDQEKADQLFQSRLAQWEKVIAARKAKPVAERGRLPKKPAPPKRPLNTEGKPGVLFDSMIAPFVGYTMQGAIWYQGEANAKVGHVPYDESLPLLIKDWRTRWNDDFYFLFVQLANFRQPSTEPGTPDWWALLQDRERLILDTTPKTGMATINDVGNATDIHPKDKKSVGERLARWALAKTYGQDVVHSGPLYISSVVIDDKIKVRFDAIGEGLKSRDGEPLKRFEIAGKNKKWRWAEARIEGIDTVIVSSDGVKNPVAVRYAWASNPEGANLVNSEGLPTSIFRTDNWDDVIPKEEATPAPTPRAKAQAERKALAVKIKALTEKRNKAERGSEEHKKLSTELLGLRKQFKAGAPTKK